MEKINVTMDKKACEELETWSRYFRANITEPKQVENIRRARKALCRVLDINYDVKDEVI